MIPGIPCCAIISPLLHRRGTGYHRAYFSDHFVAVNGSPGNRMSFIDFPVIEILVTGQLISRPIFGTYLFEYLVDFVNCLLHILTGKYLTVEIHFTVVGDESDIDSALYGAHIQAGG